MTRKTGVLALAMMTLLSVAAADSGAQGRTLTVVAGDGQPVSYAYLTIDHGPAHIADERGRIVLAVSPKPLKVVIRRIGFEPWSGTIAASDTTIRMSMKVSHDAPDARRPDTTDMSLATVHARAFYGRWLQQQKGMLHATFIGPEEIQGRHPAAVTDLLRGVGGVSLKSLHQPFQYTAAFGSPGNCSMRVLVDGALRCGGKGFQEPGAARRRAMTCGDDYWYNNSWYGSPNVDIDDEVGVSSLLGIEIYRNPDEVPPSLYPAAGGPAPGCGVIAIWTWTERSRP